MQLTLDLASPRARNTDPSTSHEAATRQSKGRANSDAIAVLSCVKTMSGATSAELATFYGLDRHMVARRLPDLEASGKVLRGSVRRCKVRGTNAVTWLAV